MEAKRQIVGGSFRDPAGFVFCSNDTLYRQINLSHQTDYNYFITSGLCERLQKDKLLISHQETESIACVSPDGYKIIQPQPVTFISYPYEWCFDQLKDAALLTLKIQKIALSYGLILKDASAYNVQFMSGRPVFIDTLSFEIYIEGSSWAAYRQFCQHFLAPLALMSYVDLSLSQLLRTNIDGIPLNLTSRLLPLKTKFSFGVLSHIHLHAKSQQHYAGKTEPNTGKISRNGLLAIVDNLIRTTRNLKPLRQQTEWQNYYNQTNYSEAAENSKIEIIHNLLSQVAPDNVFDLGGNTGKYGRIASRQNIPTVCFDMDPYAVNYNYKQVKENKEEYLLPLIVDITNPSGGIGWSNAERMTLTERGPAGLVMALALIHHLVIGANIPLVEVARYLSLLGHYLIIEFVPKSDSQVKRLLANRADIFGEYTIKGFEMAFSEYYTVEQQARITDSERIIYLLAKKNINEKTD